MTGTLTIAVKTKERSYMLKTFYAIKEARAFVNKMRAEGFCVDVSRTAGVEKDEAKDGDGPLAKYVVRWR